MAWKPWRQTWTIHRERAVPTNKETSGSAVFLSEDVGAYIDAALQAITTRINFHALRWTSWMKSANRTNSLMKANTMNRGKGAGLWQKMSETPWPNENIHWDGSKQWDETERPLEAQVSVHETSKNFHWTLCLCFSATALKETPPQTAAMRSRRMILDNDRSKKALFDRNKEAFPASSNSIVVYDYVFDQWTCPILDSFFTTKFLKSFSSVINYSIWTEDIIVRPSAHPSAQN